MTQIKLRRDTSANFTSKNPILGIGEPAYETDTKKLKIGDGTTAYTQLEYFSSGGGGTGDIPIATTTTAGKVKPDGTTITITDDGTISSVNDGGLELCDTDIVIRDDEKMFTQLQQMRRSTFDKSKFTVVGSPTITDDGVLLLDGTSNRSSYANCTISEFDTTKPFKLYLPFKGITAPNIYDATIYYLSGSLQLNYTVSGEIRVFLRSGTSETFWDILKNYKIAPTSIVSSKKDILLAIEFTGSRYILGYIVDGIYREQGHIDTTSVMHNGNLFSIGWNSINIPAYSGQIDLSQFSITVDGKEVFSGNKTGIDVINDIEIPYTLSKTGSKIVDVAYRDRVINLYEQEGQAGYYTIDEPNKNFTLPMGEIYGMIESKADKDMLNNPYSLFDSKYSDHELNNLSWLKSEGQWNAKAVYTDAYDKLLKVYNGTETVEGLSVKLSTETYTDYDFVLNTADETFRLPLLDGSEDLISDKFISRSFTATNSGYTIPITKNGQISIRIYGNAATDVTVNKNGHAVGTFNLQSSTYRQGTITTQVVKGDTIKVFANTSGVTATCNYLFFENTGNGSLYYYVGETVQNANLIDAGRIGEQLATKTDMLQASGAGMPSSKYIDLTLGASGSTYTAPANGWYAMYKTSNTGQYIIFETNYCKLVSVSVPNDNSTSLLMPVKKGDVVKCIYTASGKTNLFRFIYAEGSKEG